ncbi:MAG: penicillin-binding protein, partial [Muribaculaceae bacterium]|nr:penicillin-binding protein [Muribaculaceae bacterium]
MDKNKKTNKIVTWLWVTFSIGIILVFVLFFMVYNGMIGYMPPVEELKNPADKFATVVYSADGEELGRYFRNTGNRVYADYSDISPNV